MAVKQDYGKLKGRDKAAILMLTLGEDQCAKLFTRMHEDEIKEISSCHGAARLRAGLRWSRISVHSSFTRKHRQSRAPWSAAIESTERLLLENAADATAWRSSWMKSAARRASTMWDKLGNVNESVARQLPEERVPPNRRGGVVARSSRTTPRAYSVHPAGQLRHGRSSCACCAWKACAAGRAGRRGAHLARRIHVATWRGPARAATAHEMMAEIFNNLDRQPRKAASSARWRNATAMRPSASRR